MQISADGVDQIMAREGVRLMAYPDSRGIPTIGVGHDGSTGAPRPVWGMQITRDECAAILTSDLAQFVACVNRTIKVETSQEEFDAMVSLAFNIGIHGFAGSSVARRLNAGDANGTADAFLLWETPPELAGRRISERMQFLSGGMKSRAPAAAAEHATYTTRWLQNALNELGAAPVLAIDGDYGDATRAAVTAFQTSYYLFVDGLAGSQTDTTIEACLRALAAGKSFN